MTPAAKRSVMGSLRGPLVLLVVLLATAVATLSSAERLVALNQVDAFAPERQSSRSLLGASATAMSMDMSTIKSRGGTVNFGTSASSYAEKDGEMAVADAMSDSVVIKDTVDTLEGTSIKSKSEDEATVTSEKGKATTKSKAKTDGIGSIIATEAQSSARSNDREGVVEITGNAAAISDEKVGTDKSKTKITGHGSIATGSSPDHEDAAASDASITFMTKAKAKNTVGDEPTFSQQRSRADATLQVFDDVAEDQSRASSTADIDFGSESLAPTAKVVKTDAHAELDTYAFADSEETGEEAEAKAGSGLLYAEGVRNAPELAMSAARLGAFSSADATLSDANVANSGAGVTALASSTNDMMVSFGGMGRSFAGSKQGEDGLSDYVGGGITEFSGGADTSGYGPFINAVEVGASGGSTSVAASSALPNSLDARSSGLNDGGAFVDIESWGPSTSSDAMISGSATGLGYAVGAGAGSTGMQEVDAYVSAANGDGEFRLSPGPSAINAGISYGSRSDSAGMFGQAGSSAGVRANTYANGYGESFSVAKPQAMQTASGKVLAISSAGDLEDVTVGQNFGKTEITGAISAENEVPIFAERGPMRYSAETRLGLEADAGSGYNADGDLAIGGSYNSDGFVFADADSAYSSVDGNIDSQTGVETVAVGFDAFDIPEYYGKSKFFTGDFAGANARGMQKSKFEALAEGPVRASVEAGSDAESSIVLSRPVMVAADSGSYADIAVDGPYVVGTTKSILDSMVMAGSSSNNIGLIPNRDWKYTAVFNSGNGVGRHTARAEADTENAYGFSGSSSRVRSGGATSSGTGSMFAESSTGFGGFSEVDTTGEVTSADTSIVSGTMVMGDSANSVPHAGFYNQIEQVSLENNVEGYDSYSSIDAGVSAEGAATPYWAVGDGSTDANAGFYSTEPGHVGHMAISDTTSGVLHPGDMTESVWITNDGVLMAGVAGTLGGEYAFRIGDGILGATADGNDDSLDLSLRAMGLGIAVGGAGAFAVEGHEVAGAGAVGRGVGGAIADVRSEVEPYKGYDGEVYVATNTVQDTGSLKFVSNEMVLDAGATAKAMGSGTADAKEREISRPGFNGIEGKLDITAGADVMVAAEAGTQWDATSWNAFNRVDGFGEAGLMLGTGGERTAVNRERIHSSGTDSE
ncbi:hypothetical protein A3770_07p48510 [Chloropicon primus]|uniref:Uncharacterized protein n=4 Tax=Chloropicon primus TaxID=1764295 RepID=A0A5B8MPC0_9CHLO|nr:hypothetical protein A3770_07p48510 [Chloropicon primus]|eukprot:QDZ22333.1 hypothetical protein A3770_07p48510 [Chloropicon primus]